MFKTLFTRKNLLVLSLTIFYSIILLFTGVCIEGGHTMVSKKNPLQLLSNSFGFASIECGASGIICLVLIAVYLIVCIAGVVYERRYAIVNKKNPHSAKMIAIYISTILLCTTLSFGLGLLIQRPFTKDNVWNICRFIGQCFVITTIIYFVLFAMIGAIIMFIINLLNIDKPYKFFDEESEPEFDDDEFVNNSVTDSFAPAEKEIAPTVSGTATSAVAGRVGVGGETQVIGGKSEELDDREKVFPALSRIDNEYEGFTSEMVYSDNFTLAEICEKFRNYLAKEEKLYFPIDVIRFFISGFSASHFQILEGLSGTGKSSLPRSFAKFIGGNFLFMPVQATWRDKSNITGYFNEFSKTYSETEFLVELYRANYDPDKLYVFVLDEMNISRVEYYFADLLSVLEYPEEEWKLRIMHFPHGFIPPIKLEDGTIRITPNVYFVGTANKDDSTFTITDKVYDRAITTEFNYRNDAFTVTEETGKINLGNSKLQALYKEALNTPEYALTKADIEKLNVISEYVYDQFDVAMGNRILNQIAHVVPVFTACGGSKETAIDFMLSKKLLSKIEGRFEDYVKSALKKLLTLLEKTYGAGVLVRSEKTIQSIIKTL